MGRRPVQATVAQRPDNSVAIVEQFTETYPVDVRGLAGALGIAVVEKPFWDDISGMIECEIDGPCRITVNEGHSETRKRFTIAHEIAHYVLHRDKIGDGVLDNALYRSETLGERIEQQANRYAAAILMPRHQVQAAWAKGNHTAQALAAAFQVSPAVAEIRMRELGCVLWPR